MAVTSNVLPFPTPRRKPRRPPTPPIDKIGAIAREYMALMADARWASECLTADDDTPEHAAAERELQGIDRTLARLRKLSWSAPATEWTDLTLLAIVALDCMGADALRCRHGECSDADYAAARLVEAALRIGGVGHD